MMTTQFKVEKMMCGGCVSNVEKALQDLSDVKSVEVNLEEKTVTVSGNIDADQIAKHISDAGYPATII